MVRHGHRPPHVQRVADLGLSGYDERARRADRAAVATAEGRTVECAGDEAYVDDWLDELRSVETV